MRSAACVDGSGEATLLTVAAFRSDECEEVPNNWYGSLSTAEEEAACPIAVDSDGAIITEVRGLS